MRSHREDERWWCGDDQGEKSEGGERHRDGCGGGDGETQRMETGERNDVGEGMRMTVGNWRMARRRRWRGEAERAKRSGGG